MIIRFSEDKHYTLLKDKLTGYPIIYPKSPGRELVIQYLHDKYQTNICQPIVKWTLHPHPGTKTLEPVPQYVQINSSRDLRKMRHYFVAAQKKPADYRQAFIPTNGRHAFFMAYIKENDKEAILFSDSLGKYNLLMEDFSHFSGIKIFATQGVRQEDNHSCFTDAMVLSRDVTRVDAETGQYQIKNLLDQLEAREEKINATFSYTKLPVELLKSAQISEYVDMHLDPTTSDRCVHKEQSLSFFRQRYTSSKHSVYLVEKGEKYKSIMRVQFYINEINRNIHAPLTKEEKLRFIMQAKSLDTEDTHKLAQQFVATHPHHTVVKKSHHITHHLDEIDSLLLNKLENGIISLASSDLDGNELEEGVKLLLNDETEITLTHIDYLLRNRYSIFGLTLYFIALINQKYADIILFNPEVMHAIYKEKDFFYFANLDTYLAEKVISLYPELLTHTELEALQWLIDYKRDDSVLTRCPVISSATRDLLM